MNNDHKKICEELAKKDNLPAYIILWHEGGDRFIFGGNVTLSLGLLTYAQQAMKDYIAKRMPLVELPSDSSTVVPGGSA